MARQLFPGGIEIAPGRFDLDRVVAQSKRLLNLRRPLYEPGFKFNGCFARIDILSPAGGDAWDIIEVKSTTAVKDVHLPDLAFQADVAEGAGVRVGRCLLAHINGDYVRDGSIDPQKLFLVEDVTGEVMPLVDGIERKLHEMKHAISQSRCPDVHIGPHCNDPYVCPLHDQCWSFLPEDNVFTLYRAGSKAFKLLNDGITQLKDIPPDFALTDKQRIQLRAVTAGKPQIRRAAVATFLRKLKYPASFLDFETLATAIPLFNDARPYEQVPFQFSLHVVPAPGAASEYHSFLADGTGDPRPAFMQTLRAVLPASGSVVAYNSDFEISRLRECAAVLPEHGPWVKSIKRRVLDPSRFVNFIFTIRASRGAAQ